MCVYKPWLSTIMHLPLLENHKFEPTLMASFLLVKD